jgi:hypothetical protein
MGWWWRWYAYWNPIYYALYAISANQLAGNPNAIVTDAGTNTTVGAIVTDTYGFVTSGVFPGQVSLECWGVGAAGVPADVQAAAAPKLLLPTPGLGCNPAALHAHMHACTSPPSDLTAG